MLPELTRLDRRVLEAVPCAGAVRARDVVAELASIASEREVLEILRGLQHIGLLRHGRGGWWRRA